ncbi:MAG TPA: hypothetical protein VFC32_04120 [Pseudolabrys sp.]|nr:hypothetical protein [Pseudolabrys sp.]
MALWSEIQHFQTLIVGIIGFAGVIATLWFNARQARNQRIDERHHESEALRTALIEELKIIRESVTENAAGSDKSQDAFVPTDPMDDAYRAFTHRIGLLSEGEVRKVMYAYLTLRTYNAKLFLIGVPTHTSERHVKIPAPNIPLLIGMYKGLLDPMNQAIQVMEQFRNRQ